MGEINSLTEPWQFTALSNPYVQLWWQQLQMQEPRLSRMDILDFMNQQKIQGIYDYQKALEQGDVPSYQKVHGEFRWSDIGKLKNNPNLENKF